MFGTLTFSIAGNNGDKAGISWPGCHEFVASVGAVSDKDYGSFDWGVCTDLTSGPDEVPCFSSSSDDLDFLAPGVVILSTSADADRVANQGGTSQAAPHAVGVAALLKQMLPGITPPEIVDVLADTGVPITDDFDPSNIRITPRVDARAAVLNHDFDGDGCTNRYELGENPELGGLNDPFNPNDCTVVFEPDGLYEISHDFDDGQRRCMGAVYDLGGSAEMRVYCYTDVDGIPVNPEAYGSVSGDGEPGAPPPGPAVDTPCGDFTFDYQAVPPFQGIACDYVYGDVDGSHTVLTGFIFLGTSLFLSGCFENIEGLDSLGNPIEGQDPLGHVLVLFIFNFQTGAGSSHVWPNQPDLEDCRDGISSGAADTGTLQALKLATTEQMADCYTEDPDCAFADNDPPFVDRTGDGMIDDQDEGDGVPDHVELRDDVACGLRDPFNINDFYDVSIPRDGKIDQFTDIAGVIANYAPFGYTAGDPANSGPGTMENYDRRPAMIGSGASNYASPDGKIDLFTDISGVIAMYAPYGPIGCP